MRSFDGHVYNDRPLSKTVKIIMDRTNIGTAEMAYILGCTPPYFNNKLNRNSFQIDDLLAISKACGCRIVLNENGQIEINILPREERTVVVKAVEAETIIV